MCRPRPLPARLVEAPEQAQQAVHLVAERQAHARRLVAERRHRRGQRRAEQDRDPAQVDPQQEDRHERKRAVDLRVGAEVAQVQADAPLHQFEQRTSPATRRRWRGATGWCDAAPPGRWRRRRAVRSPSAPGAAACFCSTCPACGLEHRHGEEARRDRQAGRRHQRAERQHGPVDQEAPELAAAPILTRQIRLNVASTLFSVISSDTTRAITPAAVSWPALAENCLR